jgi:ADP-ribose pyrophosphatase YjhB (NUDIX family)
VQNSKGRDALELPFEAIKGQLSIRLRNRVERMNVSGGLHIPTGLLLTAKALANPTVFGVAGAIMDADGRVMLVRQSYMAGWRLPGGGVDRGEPPEAAIRREMKEEVGLSGGAVRLFGLYSRKVWCLTHITALFVIEGGAVDFRPNLEVRAMIWAQAGAPPPDTAAATARRLAELAGNATPDPHW